MVAPLIAAAARAAGGAAKGAAKTAAKNTAKQGAKKRGRTKPYDPNAPGNKRYNERRRAKRAAERLERAAKEQRGEARKESLAQARKLRQAVSESYQDKKTRTYKQSISQLESVTRSGRDYSYRVAQQQRSLSYEENLRRTQMLENYFRSASQTEAQRQAGVPRTDAQRLARAQSAFFYSKTRVLWQAGSPGMRNQNIVAGMEGIKLESGRPVQNLQDAFDFIAQEYADEFPTMEKLKKGLINTFDESFLNEEEYEDDSPEPITRMEFEAFAQGMLL